MNNEVEQVLKEFEELGYEVRQAKVFGQSQIIIENDWLEIVIYKFEGSYRVWRGSVSNQIHQLLTKLFKALGWYDE